MLFKRIVTAIVLLLILVGVLQHGGQPGWYAFIGVVVFTSFWEWGKLGQFKGPAALVYAFIGVIAGGALFIYSDDKALVFPFLAIAGIFWVGLAPWCLRYLSVGFLSKPRWYAYCGFFVIVGAALALNYAHSNGMIFLVSLLALCWVADIFAYFVGKLFGRKKLAPKVSPGKSWEGALGGAVCVVGFSWLMIGLADVLPWVQETWQYRVFSQWPAALFTLWLLALSAISVVGDLFESLLKRRASLKDSSGLLPGHGGVLDRVDAQLAVLPLAVLIVAPGAY